MNTRDDSQDRAVFGDFSKYWRDEQVKTRHFTAVTDQPYLEATIAGFADIIISEDQIDHVRMEAGNPDMTLREAAVWMTDQLFPTDRSGLTRNPSN